MSTFSIAYSQVADAELVLRDIQGDLDDISVTLYTASNDVGGIASLANKRYAKALRERGLLATSLGEGFGESRKTLEYALRAYSDAERRVLQGLSDLATSGSGFSEASLSIAGAALSGHASARIHYGIGRAVEDSMYDGSHTISLIPQALRYWRSTTGSDMIKALVKKTLGGKPEDYSFINDVIKKLNNKVEIYEDTAIALLHPTNDSARISGVKTLAGLAGFGGFAEEYTRYKDITKAMSDRAAKLWENNKPKAFAYAVAATSLTTAQFIGDSAYNSAKYITNMQISDLFKVKEPRKNASEQTKKKYAREKRNADTAKKVTKKRVGSITDILEDSFTQAGDWCWSRLDDAFGL